MTEMLAFADIEGVLRSWLNSQTGAGSLVGAGNPLSAGVHLRRLRSPAKGNYALLGLVGTPPTLTEEWVTCQARVSASIYGTTKESAAAGAVAYANWLVSIGRVKPVVLGVRLVSVDAISGPLYLPDVDEERYLVDCDIWCLREG